MYTEINRFLIYTEPGQSQSDQALDNDRLPVLLQTVEDTLADAGFRAKQIFEQLASHPNEIIVALGKEGRDNAKIYPNRYPRMVAMPDKLASD